MGIDLGKAIYIFFPVFLFIIRKLYPPLFLVLYLLVSPQETFGTACFFSSLPYFNHLVLLANSSLIMSVIISLNKLWKQRRFSASGNYLFILGFVSLICAIWIYLSNLLNGDENFGRGFLLIGGPCSAVIALAYYHDNKAGRLFFFLIAFQIFLSIFLAFFPTGALSIFNASRYIDSAETRYEFFTPYGSRVSGQFANTVQLSYYAAITLALGFYIIIRAYKVFFWRIVGIIAILMGGLLQFVSATRGVIAGTIFSFVLALLQGKRKIKNIFLLVSAIFLVLFYIFPSPSDFTASPMLRPLIRRFEDISTEFQARSYRRIALKVAYNNMFNKPFFGYGGFENARDKLVYISHQEPIALALVYGIPVGLFFAILMCCGIVANLKKPHSLHTMFVWVTFFLVMTNATGGGALTWIILAVTAISWDETVI